MVIFSLFARLRERIIFLADLKRKNFLSALQMGINARITVLLQLFREVADWAGVSSRPGRCFSAAVD
jgi:hypothetical protein